MYEIENPCNGVLQGFFFVGWRRGCALYRTAVAANADVADVKVSFRLRGQTRRSSPTSADGY